ncbi:MAG: hypothetical protein WBW04_04805 [Nitrolancea sp.]
MESKKQQRLVHLLNELTEKSPVMPGPDIEGIPDGGQLVIPDACEDAFRELVEGFLREPGWSDRFSTPFIQDELTKLIFNMKTVTADFSTYLDSFAARLSSYNSTQIVFLPVTGVRMELSEFRIGKIILRRALQDDIAALVARVSGIIQSTDDSQGTKDRLESEIREDLVPILEKAGVYSEFSVAAEPIRARERAEEETRKVLEVLRFANIRVSHHARLTNVGLQGEAEVTVRRTLIVAGDQQSMVWRLSAEGPLLPLELSESMLDQMTRIGVIAVGDLLAKTDSELTDFEKSLLWSVHWFADSLNQSAEENRLLSLITSLEALINTGHGEPIRSSISEGAALLIYSDLDHRLETKKHILHMYQRRSAISHGGKLEILETELRRLETIAGEAISRLIQRRDEFRSRADLANWLERKRLSD